MNKCIGCGAHLQIDDPKKEGYTISLDHTLCNRCFRINNYNEYQKIEKTNNEFIPILKKINETNSLVLVVVDILNINKDLNFITKYLNNDIILVLTKRDTLPYKVNNQKLLDYDYGIKCIDKVIISSNKNIGLDELYEKIYQYKKDKNVYIVGYSNVGKSTLINKLIYNYSDINQTITTSMLPSTTIDSIEIPFNEELTIIDTPGIIEEGNIINEVETETLKKIMCKKEIKPITYQIKNKQTITIEDILLIESSNNNFTFYMSNNLKIDRKYKELNKDDLKEYTLRINENNDIVVLGLGFIKTTNSETIKIYSKYNLEIYTRKSLI